jgi:class 3 adenylate cyclase
VIACPSCGHQNQDDAKFCSQCATSLSRVEQPVREERKVVTILFADLVGFTSRAERLDPEDVRALLSPYYARLRKELERFGGTVEKFIGDAVMAVFGAPIAHEDDPERAVRAALAIRDWVSEEEAGLQLRIAVNTGEALVSLSARPSEGEGMVSGDVVNVAARLQAAAPVNGILVGEVTHRATSQVIEYRDAAAVIAKGKADPLSVWEALEARARFGVDLGHTAGPLIGRGQEVDLVTNALSRARSESSTQLLTIVGVPGIGKSRLVMELFRAVEEDPTGFVQWRQGRSLPYGDGVTFWALSEMVKAQAGMLESDSADETRRKLGAAVRGVVSDATEAQWIEAHLRPLLGLGATEGGGDRQSEAFTAWRRFFEAIAEQNPLVLVFEDMQWAGDSLLDFVEHVIDWSSGVPLLVICTARPELLERRRGWGGGKRNAATLSLSPLSDDDTARLIGSLSRRPVMPAETQQELIARSGGNPLYAEQFVRMQAERGDAAEVALPDTVQGIIGARLDGLSPAEKDLIQNAAVMGKLFWLGGVSSIATVERAAAEQHLHALERKEFVQRARRSTVTGEMEYSFQHILVRDVAYGQIPRGRRAEKHRLAAAWLEALGRSEDHAEMLAHHYRSAADLMRAAGQALDESFAARVLASLADAGDRAYALNAWVTAAGFYASALELARSGSHGRPELLFKLSRARYYADQLDPAMLTQARDDLLAHGDLSAAAEATALLAEYSWEAGDSDKTLEYMRVAREMVAGLEASSVKTYVTATMSRFLMLASQAEEAIRVGREALAMAEQLGDNAMRASALNNVGVALVDIGDPAGLESLAQSVQVARTAGVIQEQLRALGNSAATTWELGDLRRARDLWQESLDVATRYGHARFARWFRGQRAHFLYQLGEWDAGAQSAEEFIAEVEAGAPHYLASTCYMVRALVRLARDDPRRALADSERGYELAQLAKDPQNFLATLMQHVFLMLTTGDRERAAALLDECLEYIRSHSSVGFALTSMHLLGWSAEPLGRASELADVLEPHAENPWAQAAIAFVRGDIGRAAEIVGICGAATEAAYDRLCLGRRLVEQGRRAEADVELQRALAFYRSVGAIRFIREAEALFAQSA